MRRRWLKIMVAGCAFAVLAFWILQCVEKGPADEQRLRQLRRAQYWATRLDSVEKHLPVEVISLLRINGLKLSYMDEAWAQRQALLASGVLTNSSVLITNLSFAPAGRRSDFLEVYRRLRTLRGIDYWSFYMQSNQAIITCRPSDVARIQSRVEIP